MKTTTEDCDHLKPESGFEYQPAIAIPVGPLRNIVLCKNCWNTVKALAYTEILQSATVTATRDLYLERDQLV